MIRVIRFSRLLLLVTMLSCSFYLKAAIEPFSGQIMGSYITSGTTLIVSDDKFLTPAWSTIEINQSVDDYIYFEIDEHSSDLLPDTFTANIDLKITGYDINNDSTTFYRTMQVNYNKNTGVSYNWRDVFHTTGFYKVRIKLESNVYSPFTLPASFPDIFRVRTDIVSKRIYSFDCTDVPTTTDSVFGTNQDYLLIEWSPYPGAEEYDLEWSFLDDSSSLAKKYRAVTSRLFNVDSIMRNNSTRITTSSCEYMLPIVYPKGILIYRVRAVHYTIDGKKQYTEWNDHNVSSHTLYSFSAYNQKVSITHWHEQGLNWQYQSIFAEGGKSSSNISYYDGSLRQRQQVIRSNENNMTTVGETIYDFQGRPSLKVLPSPSFQKWLHYYPNYNLNQNGFPYSRLDFDTGTCDFIPGPMLSDSGTSRYYSDQNPEMSSHFNQYIPNADGYVFSITEYTPDMTGRVSRQSNVGETLNLGSGHEIKYFYAKPMQEELDRLFGSEAGDYSHYLKNAVTDQNGQLSLSYIDAHGRTIATCLAGDVPDNLDSLPSHYQGRDTVKLITPEIDASIDGSKISYYNSFLADKEGTYHFNYDLLPDQFSTDCIDTNICFDCLYDLHIEINGCCNNAFNGGLPFVINRNNYTIGDPLDTLCANPSDSIHSGFDVFLPVGEYQISKTLQLADYAESFYSNVFLENASCLKTYSDFLSEFLAQADFSGCGMDCATCYEKIGSVDSFVTKYLRDVDSTGTTHTSQDSTEATAVWQSMYESCASYCDKGEDFGEIEALYETMKADVSPGGQYAMFYLNTSTNEIDLPIQTISFSSSSYTGGTDLLIAGNPWWNNVSNGSPMDYTNPAVTYSKPDGQPDSAMNSAGVLVPVKQLTWQEFASNWKDAWADSLVKLHPEYPYYLWMKAHQSTYDYDKEMMRVQTYDSALYLGLLDPLLTNSTYAGTAANPDSFFVNDYTSFLLMDDSLTNYKGTGLSIWEMAYAMTECDSIGSCTIADLGLACEADNNKEWENFRSLYLSMKHELVGKAIHTDAMAGGYDNLLIGDSTIAEVSFYDPANYTNSGVFNISGFTDFIVVNIFYDKTPRYISNERIQAQYPVGGSTVSSMVYSAGMQWQAMAQNQCEGYANQWMQQLSSCIMSSTDSAKLREVLVAICAAATDAQHPLGATQYPAGVVVDGVSYYSFEQAIQHILGVSDTDLSCNTSLISTPDNYDPAMHISPSMVVKMPDTCSCHLLSNMQNQYDGISHLPGDSTFALWLHNHFQSSLNDSDIIELESFCMDTNSCQWLSHSMELPDVLSCGACVQCSQVAAISADFFMQYPGVAADSNYHSLFTNYLNHNLGFNLSWYDYEDFLLTCTNDSAYTDSILNAGISDIPRDTIYHITDDCLCDTIQSLLEEYSSDFGTVTHYLNMSLGLNLTFADYNEYLKACGDTLELSDSIFTCINLYHLISDFNACHGNAPNIKDYPCMLTAYLNDVFDTSLLFSSYFDAFSSCFGDAVADSMIGIVSDCDTLIVSCESLLEYIDAFNEGRSFDPDPAYLTELHDYLEAYYSMGYSMCDYYYILRQCFDSITLYNLLHHNLPVCDDTLDCGTLLMLVEAFDSIHSSAPNYDSFPDDITSHLDSIFNTTFSFCDYWDNLYNCYGISVTNDLMGAYQYCEEDLNCNNLKTAIKKYNHFHYGTNAFPSHPDSTYQDDITSFLNAIFGSETSFCDYYRQMIDCFGLGQTIHYLGTSGCDEVLCEELYAKCKIFYLNHTSMSPLWQYQQGLGDTLNEIFNAQLTFCDWFDRYSYCYGEEETIWFFGPRPDSCTLELCISCDTLIHEIKKFNYFHPGSPFNPNYPLYVTTYLNNLFGQSLSFSMYHNMVAHCAGDSIADMLMGIGESNCYKTSMTIHAHLDSLYWYETLSQDTTSKLCDHGMGLLTATDPCVDELMSYVTFAAKHAYEAYMDSVKDEFIAQYREHCLHTIEYLNLDRPYSQYHFTLYYYDQAGNLVKTVPPEGVHPLSRAGIDSVSYLRSHPGAYAAVLPKHDLVSKYVFNSLNAPVKQYTPDADTSLFWYDYLGRICCSQSAEQALHDEYSYTLYDAIGRLCEVGQVTQSTAMTDVIARSPSSLASWLAGASNRQQVTHTYYDVPLLTLTSFGTEGQTNLRGRVTSVTYEFHYDSDSLTYDNATHYSYDIAGNVKTMVQENKAFSTFGKSCKRIDYDYDLVSGKVNFVYYEKDSADMWSHHYLYDKDNRLTEVFTARDNYLYTRDAAYDYYLHGPLARTTLGDEAVQGLDYYYTLQGYMKGVNAVEEPHDPGADGSSTGRDVMGFGLNYFANDYSPISTAVAPTMDETGSGFGAGQRSLYNGNISAMVQWLSKLNGDNAEGFAYTYDQLNRITGMNTWQNNDSATYTWQSGGAAIDDYKEQVSYDANGNILTYKRNGSAAVNTDMDDMTYHYTPHTNQLDYVTDGVSSSNYTTDIDNQSAGNYTYDANGNLISDAAEGLTMTWNAYGKLSKVTLANDDSIVYRYDAMGNRVSKTYLPALSLADSVTTWYVRDAQGNPMATYMLRHDSLMWTEAMMYGSTRLGVVTRPDSLFIDVTDCGGACFTVEQWLKISHGRKQYELTNHLGNVLATVTDKLIGNDDNSDNIVDFYTADVATEQSFFSFGMLMPERVFTAGEYKFGFNGKENENEVEGSGNLQDYGMRTYDTRLSRFISPDPLRKKYPELSTYQFASNNPIQNIDLDGLEGCDNKFEYAYSSQFIGGSGMSAEDKGTYQGAFDSYIVPAAAGLFTFGTLGAAVAYPEIAGAMMGIETYAGGCLIGEEMSEGNITTPKMEPVTANEVKMTVTPDMTPGEKFEVRQNFAKSVMGSDYTKYNGSESVNYNNPVQNTQIGPGPGQPQLVQWREPGNTTASPFFTYDGVDPSTLGIPSTYTDKYYVTLDKSYNFLQSTAGTVEGWLPEDIGTLYEGGGTQLYSKEAAQSATLILSH